jgi:hypothetical protein
VVSMAAAIVIATVLVINFVAMILRSFASEYVDVMQYSSNVDIKIQKCV